MPLKLALTVVSAASLLAEVDLRWTSMAAQMPLGSFVQPLSSATPDSTRTKAALPIAASLAPLGSALARRCGLVLEPGLLLEHEAAQLPDRLPGARDGVAPRAFNPSIGPEELPPAYRCPAARRRRAVSAPGVDERSRLLTRTLR